MTETISKVTASVVDALKGQPLATMFVVLNLTVLGLVYFASQRNFDRYERHFNQLIERCGPK